MEEESTGSTVTTAPAAVSVTSANPTLSPDPELDEIKLPSVRDLRLRFSAPASQEEKPKVVRPPSVRAVAMLAGQKEREVSFCLIFFLFPSMLHARHMLLSLTISEPISLANYSHFGVGLLN